MLPGIDSATMTRPFRLTALTPKESDLQKQIIRYLRHEVARRRVVWFCRVNSGSIKRGTRFIRNYLLWLFGFPEPMSSGYSDLHGMLAGGRYFALEIKKPGEIATPEQRQFLEVVRNGGGIGCTVFSFEDVPSVLFCEIDPERQSE